MPDPSPLRPRRTLLIAALLILSAGVLAAAYLAAWQAAMTRVQVQARSATELRVQVLESVLGQQRAVAAILSDDALVIAALATPSEELHLSVSEKLERLRGEAASAVIYLLDANGVAIAASNWDLPDSFVGESYAFREYFTGAMRDGTALQFALGTVSHRPGLYLSHDVRGPQGVLGVVVVKVEFDAQEAVWAGSPDATYVTDAAGQVILSSHPQARFAPLPAPEAGRAALSAPVPGAGWQMQLRTATAPATQAGLAAAGVAALGLGIASALAARSLRQRRRAAEQARYSADLEVAVATRTHALRDEMRERQAAEGRLARLQADLVQANKLATLGQVTAGVAHEVNQPLATIRLLAENGQAMLPVGNEDVAENLSVILRMTDRIAQITTELRGFARKATGQTGPVSVAEAVAASVLLTASRRRAEGARLILPDIAPDLRVQAEAVRLEQVLVNLIQNAQEALAGQDGASAGASAGVGAAEIRLTVTITPDRVVLTLTDTGPGLSPEIHAHLFTPFASSKPDGLGLGLVIAHDIARDFGGRLWAEAPVAGQGATFHLDLPRAS